MSLKTLQFKIASVSPLLFHNGQLSDPLNEYAIAIKRISGKRNKTEADHEEIARLEWYGGLYLTDGVPCLPGYVLEAALVNGARKSKRGKQAQAGIVCPGNYRLSYKDEAPIDKLWAEKNHRLRVPCVVGNARVMRTRPMFEDWSADIEITYDDSLLNERDVREILAVTGDSVGLCDWRPKFGRFEVVS